MSDRPRAAATPKPGLMALRAATVAWRPLVDWTARQGRADKGRGPDEPRI